MRGLGRGLGLRIRRDSLSSPTPISNNAMHFEGSEMGLHVEIPDVGDETAQDAVATAKFGCNAGGELPTNLTMGFHVRCEEMAGGSWSYCLTIDRRASDPWSRYAGIGMSAGGEAGPNRYKPFIDVSNNGVHWVGTFELNRWYHFAVRKQARVWSMVIDGVVVELDAYDNAEDKTKLTINTDLSHLRRIWINQLFSSGFEPAVLLNGSMCGAFFTDQYLTDEQIAAIAASTGPVSGARVDLRMDGADDLTDRGSAQLNATKFGAITTDIDGPYA